MKVKCLQNVCASGTALEAGETYDISDRDFALLSSCLLYTSDAADE